MKTKLSVFGCLLAGLLAGFEAKAILLFQDNFSYPNAPIGIASGGNSGGGGGIWVSGAGSLYGTTVDISATGSGSVEILGTGVSDLPRVYFTNGVPGNSIPLAPLFTNTVYTFANNAPVPALYASFTFQLDPSAEATVKNSYFAYFTDTNFDFLPRVFVVTNTASSGAYRLGIINNAISANPSDSNSIVQTDLFPGDNHQVVVRYSLSTEQATIWVDPANETSPGVSPPIGTILFSGPTVTDTGGVISSNDTSICGFGIRNFGGAGPLFLSNLKIGTSFADVVPGSDGANPVFIVTPPQNTTNFAGKPAALSVVAGGDPDSLTYQWSIGGTAIPGATSSSYSIASLDPTNGGSYTVFVADAATPSGITAGPANLTVLASDIAPTISKQPTNTAVPAGGTVNFSVTAADGGAPLSYQWFLSSTPLAGETNSSFVINSVVVSNAATYKVTVTNPNGDSITSSNATLTVNPPAPIACTIQYIRSLLDNTNYNTNASFFTNGGPKLFTVTGTNTVWENLTTSGNSEFFIQDNTAGITVFWGGAAAASHMPPAGAVVTVTAPVSVFSGLLELSPSFSSSFNSVTWTNVGPLPTPLPLPFGLDLTQATNANLMQKHLVGEYFAATNVFLDLGTGSLFGNNANEPLTNGIPGNIVDSFTIFNASNPTNGSTSVVKATNQFGQVFNVIFYNNHTDLFGAAKPTGPVTVLGVMGIFASGVPFTSGYELTPSRLADIIPAVSITNVISNVIRQGDLVTNTFNTTVLQPGETVTMTVVAHDPGGGTSAISGLTGNGTWSAISGNGTSVATATYTYTATSGAAGTADTPTLTASFSSSGFVGAYTNLNTIYVPTAAEQNIRISEVFSKPTTVTNSPAYNPLLRALPETGTISVNDQYIEIANVNSNAQVNINRWTIVSGLTPVYQFVNGEALNANTCGIVYGGPSGTDTDAPTEVAPAQLFRNNAGTGLSLNNTSGGTISIYNLSGYLIDRVAYPASGSLVGSFSRFLTLNGPLVPQQYINTNAVTPGTQYDGGSWAVPTKSPTGITGVNIIYGNPVKLSFTDNPSQVSTLWEANSLTNHFQVVFGQQFNNAAGSFSVSNTPPFSQFYFITTQ